MPEERFLSFLQNVVLQQVMSVWIFKTERKLHLKKISFLNIHWHLLIKKVR